VYYNSVREYQIRLSQRPIGSARRVIDFLHRVIADTIVMDAFVLVVPRLNKPVRPSRVPRPGIAPMAPAWYFTRPLEASPAPSVRISPGTSAIVPRFSDCPRSQTKPPC
jgi:hypothetical protein